MVKNYSPDYLAEVTPLPLMERPPIIIAGRECRQGRDVGFFSDAVTSYPYSGQEMKAMSLSPFLLLAHILTHVNSQLSTSFNGILVNRYNTGENFISPHSDAEDTLSRNQRGELTVAGLSFGATHDIQFKEVKTGITTNYA